MRGIVIGQGAAGLRHYKTLKKALPGYAHINIGSRKWDSIIQLGGAVDELLLDLSPSLVILASPAPRHLDQLLSVLSFGAPVLVEKPFLSSFQESGSLEMLSRPSTTAIQIGYVLRHSPSLKRFQELLVGLKRQRLRAVYVRAHSFLPSWRPGIDYRDSVSARSDLGGGALLELSHEIDYVLNLFGDLEISQAELWKSPLLEVDVETACTVQATTTTGTLVEMSLNIGDRLEERWCDAVWENGERLRWDIANQRIIRWENEKVTAHEDFSMDRSEWYEAQLNHFLRVVSGEAQPLPGVREGLQVMRVIEEIRKASG